MGDEVTIGEIYRRLVDIDERYDKKLDSIETQVKLTNGRTTRLEERVNGINRDIRDLKQHHAVPLTPSNLPVVTPEGESLSIRISPKMWVLIASIFTGLSMFGPILADWLKKALSL